MKNTSTLRVGILLLLSVSALSFSCKRENTIPDIPPSDGTSLTLNGGVGGSSAANIVFVDLSAERQDSAKRASWDLGFYSGSQFRVVLNTSKGAVTAKSTGQTDVNAVNASNVDVSELAFGLSFATLEVFGSFDLTDDTTGNLANTAIAGIGTGDNPVYLVNTVPGTTVDASNVWKVKISRSGSGYSLQYAKLDATSVQTADIRKDEAYNFQFFSFASGPVSVEPEKDAWDFSWGYTLYFSMYQGAPIPYGFPDFVKLNTLSGVQAAVVLATDIAYADFNETHVAGVSLSSAQNIIGSSWRATTGAQLGVLTDRYYIIKDASGNVYKLRFNSMGATPAGQTAAPDGGKRGYPELEYKLVKRS